MESIKKLITSTLGIIMVQFLLECMCAFVSASVYLYVCLEVPKSKCSHDSSAGLYLKYVLKPQFEQLPAAIGDQKTIYKYI